MKNSFFKTLALLLIFLFTGTSVVSAGSFTTAKNQAVDSCKWQYKMLKSNKNKENGKAKGKIKGAKHKDQGAKKGKEVGVTQITLNKTTLSLTKGSWERLTATVKPDNAKHKRVIWSSDRPSVATVNPSGKVTGMAAGTAIITASSIDGKVKATCTVTITANSSITVPDSDTDVTSLKIVRTTDYIALEEGTTKSLEVTIEPEDYDDSLIWSSSNTSVAVVDRHGNVTAIDEGTTVITVKTSDGSKSDSCTVRVIDDSDWVSVRRVEVNLVNTTIPVGFDENLKYRLEPASVSDLEAKWKSSNPDVASVDIYGTVHGNRQGTAEITATSADGRRSDSCLVTVTSGIQAPSSGILLNKISSTLEVGAKDFPTVTVYPAGTSLSLTWSSSDTSIATVNRSGEVTAVEEGTVVITARTADNKIASYVLVVTD